MQLGRLVQNFQAITNVYEIKLEEKTEPLLLSSENEKTRHEKTPAFPFLTASAAQRWKGRNICMRTRDQASGSDITRGPFCQPSLGGTDCPGWEKERDEGRRKRGRLSTHKAAVTSDQAGDGSCL